jgi:hypothetical protein
MGSLGHRLVEELHRDGSLAKPEGIVASASATIERLVREEASVFRRPGMTFELVQLRDQLIRAIARLAQMLSESKLSIVGVEVAVNSPWRSGTLDGRLDLLLRTGAGLDVVLDLKWGKTRYRDLLASGSATQLAVYAAGHKAATNMSTFPSAAYFSLSRGELLAMAGGPFAGNVPINGPPLEGTWANLERTVERVEETLGAGRVPVTGLRQSAPLLEAMGLDKQNQPGHLALGKEAPCQYCSYGVLCGRSWENVS